ncbi:hypothetical protein HY008_03090 [Candidatus Woesebacteria bacterium]|nr:hypothetical protein [Candidatus Woesebacteria bacterium]
MENWNKAAILKLAVTTLVLLSIGLFTINLGRQQFKKSEAQAAPNDFVSFGYRLPTFDIDVTVALKTPSFVVSYKKEGESLEFIGASNLLTGNLEKVTIKPNINLNFGNIILVKLFKDNGDSIFNEGKDVALLNPQGEIAQKQFELVRVDQ